MTEPQPEQPEQPEQPDVLRHLQAAAKELFAAGRAALDVADEVVSDGIRVVGAWLERGQARPPTPKVEKIEVEVEEPER